MHVLMTTLLGVLVWGTTSGSFDRFFTPPAFTRAPATSSFTLDSVENVDDVNAELDQILANEARP